MAEQVVKQVRGQHLHVSERHHRSRWGNMSELSASITAHDGILVPMIVRDRKAGGYEIAAGVRRWKAGTEAGLKTFPCLIKELTDEELVAIMVTENRDREGAHPMDEALYCEELSSMGLDKAMIAKRLVLKQSDVARRMRLLALSAKSRKAYVDGAIDDAAALALATTDHAKQADVIAARAAGTLQTEEIPGYIQRTFTATLDDVPWRMSDEKLLPKAGPCTTCPKRSDVQRDMFAEVRGLRCLDVDCWRAKMEASWQRELARPGVTQHDQPVDALFIVNGDARPLVIRSSGMVDADAQCQHAPGKTWREAAFSGLPEDAEGPTIYLARDQDGRPRSIMREASVSRLIKKSPPVVAAKEAAAAADPSPRNEGKIRRSLIAFLAESVAGSDEDTWSWITERVIDGATARAVSATREVFDQAIRSLDKAGLDGTPGLFELSRESAIYARRITTTILLFDTADVVGEIGESVRVLAELCGVDLDDVERDLRSKS